MRSMRPLPSESGRQPTHTGTCMQIIGSLNSSLGGGRLRKADIGKNQHHKSNPDELALLFHTENCDINSDLGEWNMFP